MRFTAYVNNMSNTGSTCKSLMIRVYIEGLANKNESTQWAQFNAGDERIIPDSNIPSIISK